MSERNPISLSDLYKTCPLENFLICVCMCCCSFGLRNKDDEEIGKI